MNLLDKNIAPIIGEIQEPIERLVQFAIERHAIYLRRSAGLPKPWTNETILQQYRFTNIVRENDPVTIWIAKSWREPYQTDPNLWFAMVVARLLNLPDSLQALGYPVPWNRVHFLQTLRHRKEKKLKNFNPAYIVSTNGIAMAKELYIADHVLDPLWQGRERLQPKRGDNLNSYHMLLGQFHGLGSFMAGQVIADLKYAPPLSDSVDWWSFACSGPGSRRGLNRALGRPEKSTWREDEWRMENERLRQRVNQEFEKIGIEPIHGQDGNNLECEFDKYERVRLGQGRPKQKYNGKS